MERIIIPVYPNAIRIISARLATRRERENYEQNAF
jgi:hypothetical protein